MMYRFYFLLAILIVVSSSTIDRSGHASNETSSRSHEDVIKHPKNASDVKSKESSESDQARNATVALKINGTADGDNTTISGGDAPEKTAFRKRSMKSNTVELTQSSSASEEIDEGGEGSEHRFGCNVTDSNQDHLNVSDANSTLSESEVPPIPDVTSNELGSGDEETPMITSNDILEPHVVQMEQIVTLKKKVQAWQNAVSSYLQAGRQRRKRQAWSQLFPPPSSSGSSSNSAYQSGKNVKDSAASFVSAAESAFGDALKPAMELMTEGVGLLSELYTAQLHKPNSSKQRITSENTTEVVDQFRDQMTQLQSKLSDLGNTLQRVVNSFQEMQVPFLDNIMSGGGMLALNGFASDIQANNRKNNALYESSNPKSDRKSV